MTSLLPRDPLVNPKFKKVRKFRPSRKFRSTYEISIYFGNGVMPHKIIEKLRCANTNDICYSGFKAAMENQKLYGDFVYWTVKKIKLLALVPARNRVLHVNRKIVK